MESMVRLLTQHRQDARVPLCWSTRWRTSIRRIAEPLNQERGVDEICSRIRTSIWVFVAGSCRDADGYGTRRNVTDNNRVRPYSRLIADHYGTKDLSARAEHHVISDGGVPFGLAQCPPAQSDALVHEDVVADFSGNRLQGPTATICAGNTGAITALHFAQNLISNGVVDRMIVLAADEAPHAMLAAYAPIPGYLARSACLPYSNSGRVISGAAVATLLESEDSVDHGRGLGRIENFGMTGDGSGPSRLREGSEAWARSFRLALGGNSPGSVDAVVAAACGRGAVDSLELEALMATGLSGRPVSTPKAIFGDAGASGALLGVAQALWMNQEEFIPGNTEFVTSGPAGLVPGGGIAGEVKRTLVSTCEAGGSFQSVTIAT